MRVAPNVTITDEQRKTLEYWSRSQSTPARLVLRAPIVLQAAAGVANNLIGQSLGTDRLLVGKCRRRFLQRGLEGIEKDAPRGGRPPVARDAMTARIIEWTKQKKEEAWERHTLELPDAGQRTGHQPRDGQSRLAGQRAQAASDPRFQTEQRQAFH